MRVRLPALLALVSATTYSACGASDPVRTARGGGAGGEGGEPSDGAGGATASTAGSSSAAAGSPDTGSGGGGGGGAGAAGAATAPGAGAGGDGGAGAEGTGGAGGSPESDVLGPEDGLPPACPGPLESYTQLTGTNDDDDVTSQQLAGKTLGWGLSGADTFEEDTGGGDCLVGGPGNDEFTSASETHSYFYGGPGADVFHLNNNGGHLFIGDFENGDTIGLPLNNFDFLHPTPGDAPLETELLLVPGYGDGANTGSSEKVVLVYDSATGILWRDTDGATKGSVMYDAIQLATIINYDGYTFDRADFEIE